MKGVSTFLHSHREYRQFERNGPGLRVVLPVIVTDLGIVESFARYMYRRRKMSRSWQDTATFAVQLLLEYVEANFNTSVSPKETFYEFADSLRTGTIESFNDPSGLWWLPRSSKDANSIICHITAFSDWLFLNSGENDLDLNPWRQSTKHEDRLSWAAYCHKRDNAFLSHLWHKRTHIGESREVRPTSLPIDKNSPYKSYPEEKYELFISDGHTRTRRDKRGRKNLRNQLITHLMHYGGLRLSEALSLWPEDVTFEDSEVIVRAYHPRDGLAPDGTSRAAYLQKYYGLEPRNSLVKTIDPLFLGWKSPLITDRARRCFEVFFYPYEKSIEFAQMWRDYFSTQRVEPAKNKRHPYAFTNQNGDPYTHRMYRKAHRLANQRINVPISKLLGTTPHGHRHAYGQRLGGDGATPLVLMIAMHHTSIESAKVYTEPTSHTMRRELRAMEARLLDRNRLLINEIKEQS